MQVVKSPRPKGVIDMSICSHLCESNAWRKVFDREEGEGEEHDVEMEVIARDLAAKLIRA
jgi:hypothetical protein